MQNPSAVISFATDGLVTTERFQCNEGKNLGEWEADSFARMFIIQPGFYRLFKLETDENGVDKLAASVAKIRGFSPRDVDWQVLESEWAARRHYGRVTIEGTRFHGMNASRTYENWRMWMPLSKDVSFCPTKGFPNYDGHSEHYYVLPKGSVGMSCPYDPEIGERCEAESWFEEGPIFE
jgi:hypothetical protein